MEISRWLLWRSAARFPGNHVFSEHERELQALEKEITDAFTRRDAGAERQEEDVPETGRDAALPAEPRVPACAQALNAVNVVRRKETPCLLHCVTVKNYWSMRKGTAADYLCLCYNVIAL